MTEIFRRASGPFFAFGLLVLAITCLSFARPYAVPIAIAVLIWFLIGALAVAIQKTPGLGPHVPRTLARGVAMLLIGGAIFFASQVVARNVAELSAGITADGDVILAEIESLAARVGIEMQLTPAGRYDMVRFDEIFGWALGTARGLITDASLVVLYVLFLLVDERYYLVKLQALVPDPERRERVRAALRRIGAETQAYLWLMSLISLGVALVTYAACAAVGVAGAGFWGFVAFVLNFIPTIGSITAVVLPVLYATLTLGDPIALAVLVSVLSATQFVAGEVVLPRVMGDRLNLSSVVILLMLVVWGAMWGPAGMFLAIPITVILTLIFARFDATRPIAVVLSKNGQVPHV
jgi:predicted PurR-regulated permease PerM